jgi:pimeloyl-ACP methyl ester carboxylesterase
LLNDDFRGGDWFYLENKGAVMPVWVDGNKQSETFIIVLHGGPGGSSIGFPVMFDAFKELQESFAFVYWEQRASGLSQGNARPESLTVEQFVEDLEKLVVLIRHKYNNPKIFLMGHSWGGALGTAFLINPENQRHISGWIEINGGHNLKYGIQVHSLEWAMTRAAEQINLGNRVKHWNKEIAWYNSNPDLFRVNNALRHGDNIEGLNGYAHDPANEEELPNVLFSTPYNLSAPINTQQAFKTIWPRLRNVNFVPEMHKITIPSLIIWGRHDGILPVVLGYEAYDNIGSANKYLYIFENSAHYIFNEEPELFVERVRTFVEKYK